MSENPMSLKEIIRDEYIKCAKDPVYFLKKYVYIQTSEGRMLFNPFVFQDKLLHLINKHDRTLILKSRQLGITTLCAAYSLWLSLFNSDKAILIISIKQEVSKEIINTVIHYPQITAYKAMASGLWIYSGLKAGADVLTGKSKEWKGTWKKVY
jgi:hypothetical protein